MHTNLQPVLFYEKPDYALWTGSAHPVEFEYRYENSPVKLWFMTAEHALIAAAFDRVDVINQIIRAPSVYLARKVERGNESLKVTSSISRQWRNKIATSKLKLHGIKRHFWKASKADPVLPEAWQLSNFSAHAIVYPTTFGKRWTWLTSEHAYQASKFFDPRIIEEIWKARSPAAAKIIARRYDNRKRPDWEDVKLSVMEEICLAKAKQHRDVQKALLATDERPIIENSPTDSFWGWGEDQQGLNMLGRIWMDIRSQLKPQLEDRGGLHAEAYG